jgi:hypothetical protein
MSGLLVQRDLATLLRGDAAAAALAVELTDEAWQALLTSAGEQLLTPEVAAALDQAGMRADLPAAVEAHLAGIAALNRTRNERIRAQLAEMLPALARQGITPLLLKGGTGLLAAEPPARMMRDLDLLVRQEQVELARQALDALGYAVLHEEAPGGHAWGYLARPGEPATVDLHTEAFDSPWLLPAEQLRAEALTVGFAGAPVQVPGAADTALLIAVHEAVGHHSYLHGDTVLRPVHDLWRAVTGLTTGDWQRLAGWVRQRRLSGPVGGMLRVVAARFGWHPPEAALGAGMTGAAARVFAWRVLRHQDGRMPLALNGLLRQVVRRIAAHRAPPDAWLPAWRLRQAVAGVTRAPGFALGPRRRFDDR